MPRRALTPEERADRELERHRAKLRMTPAQKAADTARRSKIATEGHERRKARARSKLRALAGLPCEHEVIVCDHCGEPIESMPFETAHRSGDLCTKSEP